MNHVINVGVIDHASENLFRRRRQKKVMVVCMKKSHYDVLEDILLTYCYIILKTLHKALPASVMPKQNFESLQSSTPANT